MPQAASQVSVLSLTPASPRRVGMTWAARWLDTLLLEYDDDSIASVKRYPRCVSEYTSGYDT